MAHPRPHLLTIAAVAVVVYFLCCFLHEAVGHAGAATALGVQVTKVTTAYCRQTGASELQARLIAGAGIPVNLLFGCLAMLLRRRLSRRGNDVLHYFLWLFGHMNLFSGGGYMLAFAMLEVGDVNIVVRDLPAETPIRIVVLLTGIGIALWTFFHAGKTLGEFAGSEGNRVTRAITLTLVPYLVGGAINVGASLLGVGGISLAMVLVSSIGASFGGNFPLLWTPALLPPPSPAEQTLTPTRSAAWLVTGASFLVLYILLGRGITFA